MHAAEVFTVECTPTDPLSALTFTECFAGGLGESLITDGAKGCKLFNTFGFINTTVKNAEDEVSNECHTCTLVLDFTCQVRKASRPE